MKSDLLSFELDLVKARPSAVVGEERIWHGITYVKTITGWRPKGKEKNPKSQETAQPKVKKIEDPTKQREKQLEEFASKAKDSQLEAAIKDPEQNQEVKDIAQAELDNRTSQSIDDEKKEKKKEHIPDPASLAILDKFAALKKELEETLKQKQAEKASEKETFKVIKKTGISVDGHKMFITMNKDNTGYTAKGFGLEINSEEGELLSSFKEKVKTAMEDRFKEKTEEVKEAKKKIEKETGTKLSEEFKPIETTSVKVDDHQVFIKREGDQYKASGQGVKITSEPGVSLKEFKEELKEELSINLETKKRVEEYKKIIRSKSESDPIAKTLEDSPFLPRFEDREQFDLFLKGYTGGFTQKENYFNQYRNDKMEYDSEEKEELIREIDIVVEGILSENKDIDEIKEQYEYSLDRLDKFLNGKIFGGGNPTREIMASVSGEETDELYEGEGGPTLLVHQLAVQKSLIENNYEPICLPINYQKYDGVNYNCFDRSLYEEKDYDNSSFSFDSDGKIESHYNSQHEEENISSDIVENLGEYAGNSFYRFLVEYMVYKGDISKMDKDALTRGMNYIETGSAWKQEEEERSKETENKLLSKAAQHAEKVINSLNNYIDSFPLKENVILSRRVNPMLNEQIFLDLSNLRKGDEGSFKSIQSFSYTQKNTFGGFQITLLAKKGDPVANAINSSELEFITKQNVKFKVLETGYNSMAIELIPENKN